MELIACYQRAMETDKKVDVAPSARAHLARRWLIELIGVLVLTGCIGGVYLWSMYRQLAIERQCETRLGTLRAEADALEDELVSGRAEGVFRAYSAGIHAAVLASRKESLELSVEELVRLPGVAFIHLFHPDGCAQRPEAGCDGQGRRARGLGTGSTGLRQSQGGRGRHAGDGDASRRRRRGQDRPLDVV